MRTLVAAWAPSSPSGRPSARNWSDARRSSVATAGSLGATKAASRSGMPPVPAHSLAASTRMPVRKTASTSPSAASRAGGEHRFGARGFGQSAEHGAVEVEVEIGISNGTRLPGADILQPPCTRADDRRRANKVDHHIARGRRGRGGEDQTGQHRNMVVPQRHVHRRLDCGRKPAGRFGHFAVVHLPSAGSGGEHRRRDKGRPGLCPGPGRGRVAPCTP